MVDLSLTRRAALAGLATIGAAPVAAYDQGAPAAAHDKGAPSAATYDKGAPSATGMVFEGDGSTPRGAGAAGLAGVMVSNGRDIVRTDADGRWRLPVREGDSLFVIKPTGWMTPVDPVTHLPRFAFLHQPNGTPADLGLHFAGVAPTGALPDSVDFALRRQSEPTRFDVLLFTDPQPESAAELDYVRDDVIAQAGAADVAFGITCGDIMFDDLSLYHRSNRIVGSLGVPWHACPGNHDMNLDAADDRFSRETYKRIYGARHHAWQYGGVTFVALDNVEYLGTHVYRGHIGAAQIGFLRRLLALLPPDAPVVVCMHIPLCTLAGTLPAVAAIDTAEFLGAIAGRRVVSFAGHTHTNEHWYLGPEQHHHHVLSAVSGSWWSGPADPRGIPAAVQTDGAPNGFHILSVEDGAITTRLVPAHEPAAAAMRVMVQSQWRADQPEVARDAAVGNLLGGQVLRSALGAATLLVNLFDGGPRSAVDYAIEGTAWHGKLQPTTAIDPYVIGVYARNAASIKPWVKPALSSHLWRASLPDLAPGSYRIAIHAADEYARRHTGGIVIEVVDA